MQTIGDAPPPPPDPPRRRGVIPALAGLALLAALAALVLTVARTDDYPSDPTRWSPLQVATRFNELYEAGKAEEFQALLSPAAVLCLDDPCSNHVPFDDASYNAPFFTAHESQYLAATGGTLGAECVADGPVVQCIWRQSNLLFEAGGIEPWVDSQTFRVEDGRITEYTPGYRWRGVMQDDRVEQLQYSRWVEENYPLEHAGLFEDQLMLVFDEPNRARHAELVAEWAATTAD